MLLLTQQRAHHAQDNDAEEGGLEVGYGDDGLQEQLLGKLAQANDAQLSTVATSAQYGPSKGSNHAQHAGWRHTSCRAKLSLPTGLPHPEQHEDSQSPSRAAQQLGVHDLLDDLLTQAHHADEEAVVMQQQHHPGDQQDPHSSQHVQHTGHDVHVQQEAMQAGVQHEQLQGPSLAAVAPRSNKQLLSELLQAQPQPQQQQQMPAGPGVQPAATHGPAAANAKKQKQQKQQRSVLFTGTSLARGHSTPLSRTSTPQHPAPKKKPRFSIKDIPSQRTPTAFTTPQAKGQTAGCTAGAGSGARSLASILGSAAATPNRPPGSADTSKTPLQHGSAAAFATPKHSTGKPPGAGMAAQAAQAGAAGQQYTPQGTAALPGVTGASTAGGVTPAVLFAEKPAVQTPAAAAAAAGAAPSSDGTKKRKGAAIDPLEVMSASRERQRAFLQSLPAVPAASGPNIASLQLSGVCVPLGSNLTKVWQQLQDARKKQQDHLEEHPGGDTGALELEVINKSWEAHLVKCCCKITKCPPPPSQQAAPTQTQLPVQPAPGSSQPQAQPQNLDVGQHVFVCVNSKTSHSVELQPGSMVKLHPPWHVVQQQLGAAPVLLGHFLG